MTHRGEVPERAAIYCRISDDREGRGLGVARQEGECGDLADKLGWQVSEVFIDNDLSASRARHRPGYKSMLAAIERGEADGLVVWHNDRLHRQQPRAGRLHRPDRQNWRPYRYGHSRGLRPRHGERGMTARILGAVARQESEHKAERQRAKHAELAAQGAPSGGTRPFGLTEVKRGADGRPYREVVPDEADAIRQATRTWSGTCRLQGHLPPVGSPGLRGTRGHRFSPPVIAKLMTAEWVVGPAVVAPPVASHPGRGDLAARVSSHQG